MKAGRINDQLGSQLESLSAQVEANLERGRNAWAEWKANLSEESTRAAAAANRYARENPWPLVCAATVLGLVLGAICARAR
jgi:ElaB/YqjD/DUF883 family membrane-anchored ribosome-binding protein